METQTVYEVADEFRCGREKIAKTARQHGIGMNLGGSAGWRFTEADKAKLREALTPSPAQPVARRRRRRASA